MKKSFSTTFILLSASVLGVVLNVAVNEEGNEGSAAVIRCPYNATYTHYPKYFCKGPKKECKTLMKTDGQDSWVLKGRLNLNDDTDGNKLVVTISNLSLEDEGEYGCGVNVSGPDLFIVVKLTVIKAQKQPSSTLLDSGSIMTRTGSSTDSTGSSTQTTMSRSLDLKEQSKKGNNVFLYIGGAFSAVLLVVAVIFFIKCRTKSSAGRVSNSIKDIKNVHIYEEIQLNHPAAEQVSDINHNPNPGPAFHTIYATATNQNQEAHLSNTLPTSRVPCSKENLQKPKYCQMETADAEDFNYSTGCNETYSVVQAVINNPVYTLIIAPQTDSTSDYTNAVQ